MNMVLEIEKDRKLRRSAHEAHARSEEAAGKLEKIIRDHRKTLPVTEAEKIQERRDREIENHPFKALEEIQAGLEAIISRLDASIKRTEEVLGC